jgi:myosin heavy subunit
MSDLNQPTNQQDPAPKRKDTMIYMGIIGVLIIIIIYLAVSRHNMSQQTQDMSMQRDSAVVDKANLKNEYDAAIARLDQLTSKNSQMDSMINDKNGEIANLRRQIQGILSDSRASASQLKKAKDLINELNDKTKSYEERIAELESQNNQLTNQNQDLAKQRDSTVQQNTQLKQVGSVLHASNIRMTPLHLKHGGKKETETSKAKKVDVLRINFDIDENRIAESGTKQLYLKINGPDGTFLSNAAYGSGTTSMHDGSTLNYTLLKEISLQTGQPVKDVVVDWHQDSDYKRGTYNIEIYNGGYMIGSGSVTLK